MGFRAPALLPAVSWFAAWLALTAAEEVIGRRLGIGLAKPWPAYSALVIVERILAIGIMGPIAEELAFGGMFLGWLRRRLNPSGAVMTALKMMSYSIQANPGKGWREITLISLLLFWSLYMLASRGFGWFS